METFLNYVVPEVRTVCHVALSSAGSWLPEQDAALLGGDSFVLLQAV